MAHILHNSKGQQDTPRPVQTSKPADLSNSEFPLMKRRILIADDHEGNRKQLQEILSGDNLQVDIAPDGTTALEALVEHAYSIFITDLKMPRINGMQLIEEIQQRRLPVTVIVTTGFGSVDEAVKAMRLGAYDFLTKPIDPDHLKLLVERALRERTLQDEVASLREQLQSRYSFHNIISKNPLMHKIFELISNVADTTATVLVEGETGTGKEQVARAIHMASQVRSGPLVAVNCAALPENLLESELFGHEKGSFTSAVGQRRGRFELADSGTIFLDEVGDIPAAMQAKLLRVLQERRFERVGGTESLEVDVRVIGATNRSLQKLVKRGKFREDLFYRLNVVKIDLPPLRERVEDIPLLATHFAEKYARPGEQAKGISPQAMDTLLQYRWPGNIRELENAIERACVTCHTGQIEPDDLPPDLLEPSASGR
ncbi:MAG TPA: sigma-54 dependent transcriptional regulator, partial [Gemmataceae bacterium]|nr:sigma-54 dependent transcriptional regulator [Gemmataceae bacterium]